MQKTCASRSTRLSTCSSAMKPRSSTDFFPPEKQENGAGSADARSRARKSSPVKRELAKEATGRRLFSIPLRYHYPSTPLGRHTIFFFLETIFVHGMVERRKRERFAGKRRWRRPGGLEEVEEGGGGGGGCGLGLRGWAAGCLEKRWRGPADSSRRGRRMADSVRRENQEERRK